MRIIDLTTSDDIELAPSVATIGFFDGVHRGHQFLLQNVVKAAVASGMESMAITFDAHPRAVLHSDYQPKMLSSLNEKLYHLRQTQLDNTVVLHFDEQLAHFSAKEFMDIVLRKRLNVRRLVMGYDNRFGHHHHETFDDYVRYGEEVGIEVLKSSAFMIEGTEVSSSVVRRLIETGDMPFANKCLGYPYQMEGVVIPGFQNGRRLGFPTANLSPTADKLIPAPGVYAVRVYIAGEERAHGGMINIGVRPTFHGRKQSVEVNIFDYEGNLYRQRLRILFFRHIREERKFDTVEQLTEQLRRDKAMAEVILEAN
ncbi:UNVERIFIED_CONTAM: riboflavin biosynthesis protein RibF [Prevotella sp. 15_C9]